MARASRPFLARVMPTRQQQPPSPSPQDAGTGTDALNVHPELIGSDGPTHPCDLMTVRFSSESEGCLRAPGYQLNGLQPVRSKAGSWA